MQEVKRKAKGELVQGYHIRKEKKKKQP